jgi:hypothetical protein
MERCAPGRRADHDGALRGLTATRRHAAARSCATSGRTSRSATTWNFAGRTSPSTSRSPTRRARRSARCSTRRRAATRWSTRTTASSRRRANEFANGKASQPGRSKMNLHGNNYGRRTARRATPTARPASAATLGEPVPRPHRNGEPYKIVVDPPLRPRRLDQGSTSRDVQRPRTVARAARPDVHPASTAGPAPTRGARHLPRLAGDEAQPAQAAVNFALGAIVLVVAAVADYLGFTKSIPFRHHYEIKAAFTTSNNIKKLAGADRRRQRRQGHQGRAAATRASRGALVTMRLDRRACRSTPTRPLHPPAHLPRGQLLRRHQAGLTQSRRRARRRHTIPIQPDLGAGPARPGADALQATRARTCRPARRVRRGARQGRRAATTARSRTGSRLPRRRDRRDARSASSSTTSRLRQGRRRDAAALDRNPASCRPDHRLQHHRHALRVRASACAGDRELPRTLRAGLPALAR